VGAFAWAVSRLQIDFDILNALPRADEVTRDAREVIKHNPALDRVVFDLSLPDGTSDRDRLVRAADIVSLHLRESGLFRSVGTARFREAMPELISAITENLPMMFDENDLEEWEAEGLTPGKVRKAVGTARERLLGLEGIGQARWIEQDPLELRYRVLGRMARISFYRDVQFYRDHLLSGDGKHLLLLCDPAGPATNTAYARKLTRILDELAGTLEAKAEGRQSPVEILALGSYRYALDNEEIVRRDATRALVLITVGIAVLLLLSFPRAWVGLLALLPAVAGAMLALFVYSLFRPGISALALGFGGGLISITVDHSIAYLLFLDRTEDTRAAHASSVVWSVGLFAVVTTAGAFCVLLVSGFPLLAQVGLFAALGIVFSFLFLHLLFPLFIPALRAARRPPILPVERILTRAATSRGWLLFGIAVILAVCAAFFARPAFRADLRSMNTVTKETLEAETAVSRVWGDITSNIYVMLEGKDPGDLHRLGDELADRWEEDLRSGVLSSGFTASMILPGPDRAGRNLRDWERFWTPERTRRLRFALEKAARDNGFSPDAFQPFLEQVESPRYRAPEIPETLYDFFGISQKAAAGGWMLLATAAPGERYDAETFFRKHKSPSVRVFDPNQYSDHLSAILAHTFVRMLLIIAGGVFLVLVFLFLDLRLVLLTLAPLLFSLVCTLATLKLLGRPLDIPSLVLAIVIFGMGVDYGIFLVRSQQRFLDEEHPSQGPIRTAVLLAAASTLLGMGALAFSRHAVLRSVGITSFLGIGYSLLGAFILLPPCLARLYRPRVQTAPGPLKPGGARHRRAALARFDLLGTYTRFFARTKMRIDPLFARLADLVPSSGTVLDIGCGRGVPAAWLMALHPGLRFVGVEPDPEKVRVASRVLGSDGLVLEGTAQDLPAEPAKVDAVLCLDVGHYLTEEDMDRLLRELVWRLGPEGPLVMRITIQTDRSRRWKRFKESVRVRLSRHPQFLRSPERITEQFLRAGFELRMIEDEGRDLCWFVASPEPGKGART
jgi:predicted exporter/SAM-dependent methyltransferase